MSCTRPLYRIAVDGTNRAFLSNYVKRERNGGIILRKYELKDPALQIPVIKDRIDLVPCGQCVFCKLNESLDMAKRCMLETKFHKDNYFVTLTYDNEHLPFGPYTDVETGEVSIRATLYKKDVQDFMKRLRMKIERATGVKLDLSYLVCGERGEKFDRPHYHAILFGCPFDDLKPYDKSDPANGIPLFTSKFLDETWGNGMCVVGNVDFESCAYVARYSLKKMTSEQRKKRKALDHAMDALDLVCNNPDDLLDPRMLPLWQDNFRLVSKRPAIGRRYYNEKKDTVYLTDEVL